MFRIVCDPSSGSIKLYLTEIRSGSLMFVVCLVSVWQRTMILKSNRGIKMRKLCITNKSVKGRPIDIHIIPD